MFRAVKRRKSPSTLYFSTSSRSFVSSSSDRSRVRLFSIDCCAAEQGTSVQPSLRCVNLHYFVRFLGARCDARCMLDSLAKVGCCSVSPWTHCVCEDGLGCGVANAIDVLQRELDALLVGDVHSRDTGCLHAQRRPAAHALPKHDAHGYQQTPWSSLSQPCHMEVPVCLHVDRKMTSEQEHAQSYDKFAYAHTSQTVPLTWSAAPRRRPHWLLAGRALKPWKLGRSCSHKQTIDSTRVIGKGSELPCPSWWLSSSPCWLRIACHCLFRRNYRP